MTAQEKLQAIDSSGIPDSEKAVLRQKVQLQSSERIPTPPAPTLEQQKQSGAITGPQFQAQKMATPEQAPPGSPSFFKDVVKPTGRVGIPMAALAAATPFAPEATLPAMAMEAGVGAAAEAGTEKLYGENISPTKIILAGLTAGLARGVPAGLYALGKAGVRLGKSLLPGAAERAVEAARTVPELAAPKVPSSALYKEAEAAKEVAEATPGQVEVLYNMPTKKLQEPIGGLLERSARGAKSLQDPKLNKVLNDLNGRYRGSVSFDQLEADRQFLGEKIAAGTSKRIDVGDDPSVKYYKKLYRAIYDSYDDAISKMGKGSVVEKYKDAIKATKDEYAENMLKRKVESYISGDGVFNKKGMVKWLKDLDNKEDLIHKIGDKKYNEIFEKVKKIDTEAPPWAKRLALGTTGAAALEAFKYIWGK